MNIREAVVNLLKIKSIVTIIVTIVFAYLAVIGTLTGEQVMTIFGVVIAFYFGTQMEKNREEK